MVKAFVTKSLYFSNNLGGKWHTFLNAISYIFYLPYTLSYADVKELLKNKDTTTHEYLSGFIEYLSIGLNNIINIYNPETIVLNSEILRFYPNAIQEIEHHLKSTVIQYRKIVLSQLGNKSAAMGACASGISCFFDVSDLSLPGAEKYINEQTKPHKETLNI